MPDPGDVMTVDFIGATGVKRRPAVVISSALYHAHRPSAFRAYFGMALPADVQVIGHLSARDWNEVQTCLTRALAIQGTSTP